MYSPLDPALIGGVRTWLIDFWGRYLNSRNAMLHIVHTATRPSASSDAYRALPSHTRVSIEEVAGTALPGSGGRLPRPSALAGAFRSADVCYFDNGYALQDAVVLRAARSVSMPVISGHHAVIKFGGLHDIAWELVGRRLISRFDSVHALNAKDAQYLKSIGARNVHLIPIAVDLQTFAPKSVRAAQFTVLFVGRLHFQKGIDRLVRVVELAQQRAGSRMRFVIAGSGPLLDEVARISDLPTVTVIASADRGEVAELMANAHALIVPSRYETFGVVAAEALAAGTPIVATDTGAMEEMASDGRGEIIRDADDPESWFAALSSLHDRYRDDASFSAIIGANTRGYAEQAFAFDRVAQAFDALLQSAMR